MAIAILAQVILVQAFWLWGPLIIGQSFSFPDLVICTFPCNGMCRNSETYIYFMCWLRSTARGKDAAACGEGTSHKSLVPLDFEQQWDHPLGDSIFNQTFNSQHGFPDGFIENRSLCSSSGGSSPNMFGCGFRCRQWSGRAAECIASTFWQYESSNCPSRAKACKTGGPLGLDSVMTKTEGMLLDTPGPSSPTDPDIVTDNNDQQLMLRQTRLQAANVTWKFETQKKLNRPMHQARMARLSVNSCF